MKIPLSAAFLTVISEMVLPEPEMVIPRPELPLVEEKSIVALFLPAMLTPLLRLTEPLFIVPSMIIVVPFEALLMASLRLVPPFLTVIVLPEVDELPLPEPLPEPLSEPLPELPEELLQGSNLNC